MTHDKELIAEGVLDSCRRLVNFIHTASKTTEKSLGLSAAQLFVLEKLRDGKPRSVTELASLTQTHQSSVSGVVKKLVAKDLVTSTLSEEDARRHLLELSPKGLKILEQASGEKIQDQLLSAVRRLPVKESGELDRLLDLLLSELQQTDKPASLFLED